ncbi:MAG TPA: hypothetical protein VFV86_08410, partial [Nitrososphaeraceae archaeon]|nr:hypothetical protein [Nitrososphaeraceae archaeon]
YKDLLQIKQKYNIQEIQIHGAPSSDDIYALYSQILILINNNNDWGIRWNKKRELSNLLNTKYSRSTNTQFKDWVKTLPRSKLNSLLGDLLKFRDSIK